MNNDSHEKRDTQERFHRLNHLFSQLLSIPWDLYLLFPWVHQARRRFLSYFCRYVSVLCAGHLPLPEGLAAYSRSQRSAKLKTLLAEISEEMKIGQPLGKVCRRYPGYFPPFFCRVVDLGERWGGLQEAMDILHLNYRQDWHKWHRVWLAFFYPLMVLLFSSVLYLVILFNVLPRYQGAYQSWDVELPRLTLMVIWVSANLSSWVTRGIVVVLLLVILVYSSWKFRKARYGFYCLIRFFPFIGKIVHENSLASFWEALELLLQVGAPMPEAVREATGILSDEWLKSRILDMVPHLDKGEALPDLLERKKLLTGKSLWMLRLGYWREELPDTLKQMNMNHRIIQKRTLQYLSLLEPLAVLAVGFIQFFIVAATYLPLFNIVQAIRHYSERQ